MKKLNIINKKGTVKRPLVKVNKLRPLYTYADPKDEERFERSLNRNKRRNKK